MDPRSRRLEKHRCLEAPKAAPARLHNAPIKRWQMRPTFLRQVPAVSVARGSEAPHAEGANHGEAASTKMPSGPKVISEDHQPGLLVASVVSGRRAEFRCQPLKEL